MEPRAAVLTASFDIAHMVFNSVLGDLTDAAGAFRAPGEMIPTPAAIAAHAIFGEDMVVAAAAQTPLVLESGTFGPRTGLLEISNAMTPEWLVQRFQVEGLKEYAAAVFARTAEFLASATSAELDREITSPIGRDFGAADFLGAFGVVHLSVHAGDISALKGVQGLKGLPF